MEYASKVMNPEKTMEISTANCSDISNQQSTCVLPTSPSIFETDFWKVDSWAPILITLLFIFILGLAIAFCCVLVRRLDDHALDTNSRHTRTDIPTISLPLESLGAGGVVRDISREIPTSISDILLDSSEQGNQENGRLNVDIQLQIL